MPDRLRLAIGLIALIAAVAWSAGAAAITLADATEVAGKVKYHLDASSDFDSFDHESAWLSSHVGLITAYAPFGDVYVPTGIPVIGYDDAATDGFAPLTTSSIEAYVSKVKRDASAGYAGAFLDDVNWSTSFRDGTQSKTLEPEVQQLAALIEATRAAIPNGVIEINSQYHDIYPLYKEGNPYVLKALSQVNMLCKEFGVGPTSGIDTASDYANFLSFTDELRAKGIHITMTGDRNSPTAATMEYNEATYLLINDGHDYISGWSQSPLNWWPGFSVNLGQATDERHPWDNVLRRDFTGGMTLVNPPGSSTQTVSLPSAMKTTTGATVTSVTLAPASGAVLTGAGTTATTPASTEGSAPAPTQTTLETTPVSSSPAPPRHGNQTPHGTKSSAPTGHASVDGRTSTSTSTSTRTHRRRAAQARRRGRSADHQAGGRKRSRAALTRVSGAVLHATLGKVRVKVELRRRGRWVVAKSMVLRVSAAGRFLRLLRLRDGGLYRLAARYMGTSSYAASSSTVDTLIARAH
jgi:hypothetical protein